MARALLAISLLLWVAMASADSLTIDDSDCKDAWIYAGGAFYNYGADDELFAGDQYSLGNKSYTVLLYFDWSSYTGSHSVDDIDSVIVVLNVISITESGSPGTTDSTMSFHNLLVEFAEGDKSGFCPNGDSAGATNQKRKCLDTDGGQCGCTGTGSVNEAWNSDGAAGAGTDYDATDSVNWLVDATGVHRIVVTDLAKEQMSGTNYGFRLRDEHNASSGQAFYAKMYSREAYTESARPYVVVYYTESAASASQIIRVE